MEDAKGIPSDKYVDPHTQPPMKQESEKVLTWKDIKELLSHVNEEQLNQPVRWWGDGRGGRLHDANVLDEDYVSDGEAYGPRSEFDPESIDEEQPVVPKGTVMLW